MKYLGVFALVIFICASCSKNNNNNTTINNADSYFMQQASYSNRAAIDAGAIAATNGSYDSVRIFGVIEVSDHGNAENALDSLASTLKLTVPSTADSAHQAMDAYLQTLSGNTFDTAYINAQVKDHMSAIIIFQQELSAGNNQQIKDYANKYLPVLQTHLQEAQSIQQTIQ